MAENYYICKLNSSGRARKLPGSVGETPLGSGAHSDSGQTQLSVCQAYS